MLLLLLLATVLDVLVSWCVRPSRDANLPVTFRERGMSKSFVGCGGLEKEVLTNHLGYLERSVAWVHFVWLAKTNTKEGEKGWSAWRARDGATRLF